MIARHLTSKIALLALVLASCSIADELNTDPVLETYLVEGMAPGDALPSKGFASKQLSQQDLALLPGSTLSDQLLGKGGFRIFRRQSALTAHPTTQGAALRVAGPNAASRAQLYLDGVPMNDPFGGWIPWTALNPLTLSQTAIVQPSGVDPWGYSSMGGTLWLQSERDDPYIRTEVTVGEALDHRWHSAFLLRPEQGPTGIFGGWSHIASHGYPVIAQDQRGSLDENATLRSDAWHLGIRHELGEAWEVSGELRYHEESRGNGTPLARNGHESWQARLSLAKPRNGADWEGRLSAYWHHRDFYSTFTSVDAERTEERAVLDQFDVPAEATGLTWRSRHWVGENHEFLLGLDGRFVQGETNERFRNLGNGFTRLRQAGGERWQAGAVIAHRWQVRPTLVVDSRGQLEQTWERDGHEDTWNLETGTALTGIDYDNADDLQLNARIALEWEPSDNWSAHWSGFVGNRRPTLNELYRPFRVGNDITLANAELDNERLWGTTLGWEWRPNDAWTFQLEGFWHRLDDGIANVTLTTESGTSVAPWGFIPAGGSGRQRLNVDHITVRGLESQLQWRSDAGLGIELGYLLTDTKIESSSDQADLEGKQLAQAPEQQAHIALTYDSGENFFARVETRWIDRVFDDDLNQRPLDDYVSLNAMLGWRFTDALTGFVSVENLLDEEIEVSHSGSGLIGIGAPRLVHLGLRLHY